MKVMLVALATVGAFAAAGFPRPEALGAPQIPVAAAVTPLVDSSWQESASLLLLATGMFGAAVGLRRRSEPIVTPRPD